MGPVGCGEDLGFPPAGLGSPGGLQAQMGQDVSQVIPGQPW